MSTEIIHADAIEWLKSRDDASVDMVIGSPSYALKGERYGPSSKKWPVEEWVSSMLDVTSEACRVSRAGRFQPVRQLDRQIKRCLGRAARHHDGLLATQFIARAGQDPLSDGISAGLKVNRQAPGEAVHGR